jgi:DNA-binding transcriptional MerR regulator
MIKIKDFAAQTNFSIRMLRYLEDIDLLIPLRDTNNYRIYSESQVTIAKGIKNLKT